MKKTKVFIFDIDDTLYMQIVPFYNACKSVVDERMIVDKEGLYKSFSEHGLEVFEAVERGEISLKDSRKYRIITAMKDWDIPFSEEQAELFQQKYLENQQKLFMSETMKEILKACIENNIELGVMSNGPYEHQMNKMKVLGADAWVSKEHCFISGKVGASKPDPYIFETAEKAMGALEKEFYMIGDSFKNDIKGAMNAGWKTVWLDYHKGVIDDKEPMPDYIAHNEEELKTILLSLML